MTAVDRYVSSCACCTDGTGLLRVVGACLACFFFFSFAGVHCWSVRPSLWMLQAAASARSFVVGLTSPAVQSALLRQPGWHHCNVAAKQLSKLFVCAVTLIDVLFCQVAAASLITRCIFSGSAMQISGFSESLVAVPCRVMESALAKV